jgi:tetratricopeptide (TPR) repeat protein
MEPSRLELLKESLAARPRDPFLRYALAMEFVQAGKDEESWGHFEILLAEQPQYLATYYQAGILLARLGRIEEARGVLARGVGLAYQQGNAHTAQELRAALADLEGSST